MNVGPLAASKSGDKPIRILFEARKLTCRTCKQPFAGLTVRRKGPTPQDSFEIAAYWREGASVDPAIVAYWEGFRKASARA